MLITEQFLESVEREYVAEKSELALVEKVDQHNRSAQPNERRVFLSHKHSENAALKRVIALLNSLGVSVYVDWMDHNMPVITSPETARKLKEKIRFCHRFILLATSASIVSQWCNWELGYGDAQKSIASSLALLPVVRNDGSWPGNEYLAIYPHIERRPGADPIYYVVEDGSRETRLEEWLGR